MKKSDKNLKKGCFKMRWLHSFCIFLLGFGANALDNGLALTPPMGWLSWARFICNVDCKNDPENCISEKLYMDMADRLVSDGWFEVGYEFVNVDDCWMSKTRDSQGRLQADPERFPSGIKALADYVHAKGLKLGIYEDVGTKTCGGYPGSMGYFDIDAQTFAEWGIDMVKLDGCYAEPKDMDKLYPLFGKALNKTGRPMVYSCSWPAYQTTFAPNYTAIAENCNLWRNFDDIEDSWQSVLSIVDFYAKNQITFIAAAGPGHWNDPDMIIGGNFGLSLDEAKVQFSLWAILASPLLLSNDLRKLDPEMKEVLSNKDVIAINQDKLGIMGKQVYSKEKIEIWKRPISPVSKDNQHYSHAIAVINRRTLGGPVPVTLNITSLGLNYRGCYYAYDVYERRTFSTVCPCNELSVVVNPSGVALIVAKITQ